MAARPSRAAVAKLADAWKELVEDDDLSCAIITGAEGNFSSGMDLRAMAGDVEALTRRLRD